MKHAARALIAVSIAAAMVGCSSQPAPPAPHPSHSSGPKLTGACGTEPQPHRYFGVIDQRPGGPAYSRFLKRTKAKPTLVDYFANFGHRWSPGGACFAVHHGAMPVVQFNLRHASAAKVASGTLDSYISHLADQMKAFGYPIVISIGHEMNGPWYSWGWKHTPVSTFVKMWRHVHDIFARQKASNVIWMWTVNVANRPATNPRPWWPGQQYVNWVGIDGHDRHPTDRFHTVFGPTISEIQQVTSDPILISETAVVAGPQRPAQIANLFRTVYSKPGMIGIIFLDVRTVRIDWRLRDTASLSAFTRAVRPYEAPANG